MNSNNGSEFTNKAHQAFFYQKGITHETSHVDTPQQNSRLECRNRHQLNLVLAIRFQASLPLKF